MITAIIIEVVFMAYAVKTRDMQNKSRSWLRIAAFVAFGVLAMTPAIDWGFRWYMFASLLAFFAVIAAVRLFTNRFSKKSYKTSAIVSRGIAMLLIFAIAALPALIFPQYKLPSVSGEYAAGTASYTFTDTARIETFTNTGENRKLNVEFWYPKEDTGKYPLIVFSHGAFGVKMSNASTFVELASNGYVVCSIDHPYHAAGTVDTDGHLTIGSIDFRQEVMNANSDIYSEKEQYGFWSKWMDLRTDDLNFVIDTILKNTEMDSADVYQLIDKNKIGLIGHSLGGAASAQIGRERHDIGAVVDLDGTMLGETSLSDNGDLVLNEEPYALPLLNFYSEYVIDELKATPDYVYPNKHVSSISPEAFDVCIKGSTHMSFTDLPLFSPLLANQLSGISGGSSQAHVDKYYCIETMNSLVLQFFNCYLKGEGNFSAKEYY